jgi:sugar transferase (PEP-CTERM/EpsH1 system associated)
VENLLLLVHRIPYPPNKGDKIRSYHLLKHLAGSYRVHLGTFVDDANDWQHVPLVKALCADSHFAALNPRSARIRSLGALLTNRSLSLDYYRDRTLQHWVDELMQRVKIDRVLVFSSAMTQYVEAYSDTTRVVDFVDVDSDKWRQYAAKKSWPMSWLYRHEARQLLRYERHVAGTCDASLFVSEPEAALFRTLAPESTAKIGFFNNGVDTDYFSPDRDYPDPYPQTTPVMAFTGAMDYWPNIDAVQWFAAEVFPALRKSHATLQFYIVGARPSDAVKALANTDGIVVTGTVADVRPYIAHAAVAIAPLRVARGIQNKVLEAMAMARPTVVSPQALEGIDATPGSELLVAETASDFVDMVSSLLRQENRTLGVAARRKVEQAYSWPSNLAAINIRLESRSHQQA